MQQNPIPSMSQQAVSDPVTTTPSSVDLPPSGTITPQIFDQTKVTRYERVPELARSTLKEGATQSIILQVIANHRVTIRTITLKCYITCMSGPFWTVSKTYTARMRIHEKSVQIGNVD